MRAADQTPGMTRQLPSGRWKAVYVDTTGKERSVAGTFATEADAQSWLTEEGLLSSGGANAGPAVGDGSEKFSGFADRWVEQRRSLRSGQRLRPRTRDLYRDLLRLHINPTLGNVRLDRITAAVIRRWHQDLSTGSTRSAHAYSLLHAILQTAVSEDAIDANPCKIHGAMSVSIKRHLMPLTAEQLHELAAGMPDTLEAPILVMGWCGLRVGEMRALQRADVADDGSVLRINKAVSYRGGQWYCEDPKTSAGIRSISVPPHIRPILVRVLPTGLEDLVFPAPNGGYLADWMLRRPFKRAALALGHNRLRIHDLRHTGATLAAQNGATMAEIMRRIGHATPVMAMRYQHASDARDAGLSE